MALIVPILTSFDGNGIKRAVADFKRLETSGQRAGFLLSKAFLPAVGALAGLAVAAGKSMQAAIADEGAQASLARTLRVSGNATDATIASVEKYIKALGKQVAISDDEARPALATLVLATKDVAKAQELMTIAIDTSAATGKPLADVSEAMSKGFAGNTKALKQLSPELFQLVKDGAGVAEIFAQMETNFAGAGELVAGTTSGQIKTLQIQLKETSEAIGQALLPVLEAVLPFIQKLGQFFEDNTDLVVAMGTGIGVMATALIALRAAAVISTVANLALAGSLTAVQIATGIGIVAVAVGAAAFVLYNKMMKSTKEDADKAAAAVGDLTGAMGKLTTATDKAGLSQKQLNEYMGPLISRDLKDYTDGLLNVGVAEKLKAEAVAKALAAQAKANAAAAKEEARKQSIMAKAQEAMAQYTSALQGFASAQQAVKDAVKSLTDAQLSQGNALDDLRVAQDKFNKVSKGYGAGSKEAKEATRNLAQAQRDATRASIAQRDAVQSVADAQQKLDDLKSGKATNRATEDLASATARVADAQKKLDAAYIQGGQDTINDAVGRLNDAYDKQKEATDAVREAQDASNPEAIAQAEDDLTTAKLDLVEQTLAQADANQKVIDSQTLLDEAISGAKTDTDIYKEAAKELADAQKAVADANDLVTQSLLDQAVAQRELNLARTGVTDAAKGTTTAQEASAQRRTGVNPKTGETTVSSKSRLDFLGVVNQQLGTAFKSIKAFINSGKTDEDKARKKKRYNDFAEVNGLVMMANGGIVNRPTLAMLGESGAEAVIPLDKMNNGSTYNITVNAGIGDPVAIGREVVSVLQAYQRRSGAIPIKVA